MASVRTAFGGREGAVAVREAAVRVAVMAKGGEWRVERWRGGERPEGEGEGGRRQGGRGGRRGGRRRRKERRRSAGCRERRGGVLSVCPCRHVCRQHLSCVHPAPVSPSSLSIAGHAPLGWTCRRRSGRPSSGPPRPPGSIRIRSVSSPAAVLRGRRPRARWARSAAFPQLLPMHESTDGFGGRSWLQFYECLGTS